MSTKTSFFVIAVGIVLILMNGAAVVSSYRQQLVEHERFNRLLIEIKTVIEMVGLHGTIVESQRNQELLQRLKDADEKERHEKDRASVKIIPLNDFSSNSANGFR